MPKGSSSFCLYDTCGLSDDLNENIKIVDRWMKKGVRHGKLITRFIWLFWIPLKKLRVSRLSEMLLLTGILMMQIRSLKFAEIDTVPVRPMWLIVSYLLSVRSKFYNRWTAMMKQKGNKLELLLQISTTLSCHSKVLIHFIVMLLSLQSVFWLFECSVVD